VNPEHWSWGSMLFEAQNSDAELSGYWWWYIPPGLMVAFLGTSLALLNFGIDEFINPRLRAAGLTRRRARKAGGQGLPRPAPAPSRPRSRRHDRRATAGHPRPAGGLRSRPGRRARRGGRGPGAAPRRGARAGRGERERQVHAGLRGDPAAPGAWHDHRRRGALLPRAGPDRGPARPGRAGTARAALVADRRGAAVRDERTEPGADHRRPAYRRAPGAPAGPAGPGPHRPGRRTAQHGRDHRRPA